MKLSIKAIISMLDLEIKVSEKNNIEFSTLEHKPFGKILFSESPLADKSGKEAVVDRLMETLLSNKLILKKDMMKTRLCLDEAVVNAMEHGSHWDSSKKVEIVICVDDTDWAAIVSDTGEGFCEEDMPIVDDTTVWLEGGRGIFLMKHYMDNVVYFNEGRSVLLKRHIVTECENE